MKNIIGSNIQRLRKEQGMTQHAFAEKLGLTAQAVSKWETGTGMPDINFLPAIADLFDVSIDSLFVEYDEDAPKEDEGVETVEVEDASYEDPEINFTYVDEEAAEEDYDEKYDEYYDKKFDEKADRYTNYFNEFFSDGMFNSEKIEEFMIQVKEDVRSSLAKGFDFDINSSYVDDEDVIYDEDAWEESEAEWEASEAEWEASEAEWEAGEAAREESDEDWESDFEERMEEAGRNLGRSIENTVNSVVSSVFGASDKRETSEDTQAATEENNFVHESQNVYVENDEVTKPEYNNVKRRLELTGVVKTLNLDLSGSNKFYIRKSNDNVSSLRIEATDKVLGEVTLSHKNGELSITRGRSVKSGGIFNFSIGVKDKAIFHLDLVEEDVEFLKLRLSGATDLVSELNTRVVDSRISGAGDVKLKDAAEVNSKISGAGDLDLANVGNIHSETSGAGDVKIGTISGNGFFKVSGAGSIKVGECYMQDLTLRFSGAADFRSKASVNNLEVRASAAVSEISVQEIRGKKDVRGMKLSKVRVG